MTVVTFERFLPPARYDGNPWTQALIEEASSETGTYTLVDTVTLTPVDTDPADPAYRSFTTENGTAAGYWYRVSFADATGDLSAPTEPIQNIAGAGPPTVQAYATTAQLFRELEIRVPTPDQVEKAQRALDAAALEIDQWIGRTTPYDDPPALVVQVNLDRAVEHWAQANAPYGMFQVSGQPILTARDSSIRHRKKLLPLKETWPVA